MTNISSNEQAGKETFVEKVMSNLWTWDDHVIDPRDLERLRADAARKFDAGWSAEDTAAFFRCTEEVTPTLSEAKALARMAVISAKYENKG